MTKSAKKSKVRAKSITAAKRANIKLPPTRIMKLMKRDRLNKTIRRDASVFMAGVLNYIVEEVFDLSGEFAKKEKKGRINTRHIKLALGDDPEFSKVFHSVVIREGGVNPHIEEALLPKKGKKGADKAMADQSQVV